MNLDFNILNPLCAPNVKSAVAAAALAYDVPTFMDPASGEQVLIQDRDNCFVISYPGTHNFRDVIRDAEFMRVETTILGRAVGVHEGFDKKFRALRDRVIAAASGFRKPVFVLGHSAGAAVAERCALALLQTPGVLVKALIMFGKPRSGDKRLAALCNDVLCGRVLSLANAADVVPWMPGYCIGNRPLLPNGYLPPGTGSIVTGASLLYELACNFKEIFGGWRALWSLKNLSEHDPAWLAAPLINAVRDHHINNYARRINVLT